MSLQGEVRFVVEAGLGRSVETVLGSLEQRLRRIRALSQGALGGGRGAVGSGVGAGSGGRGARGAVSEAEWANRAQARLNQALSRQKETIWSREQEMAKVQMRLHQALYNDRIRHEKQLAKEEAKRIREATSKEKEAAREKARLEKAAEQLSAQRNHWQKLNHRASVREEWQITQAQRREEVKRQREAEKAERARQRTAEAANERRKLFAQRTAYGGIVHHIPGMLHRAGRAVTDVMRGAGLDLSLYGATARNIALESGVTGLINQAALGGHTLDREALTGQIKAVSSRYGVDRQEVIRGIDLFSRVTGNMPGAIALTDQVMRRAFGTNTAPSDMFAMAGEIMAGLESVPQEQRGEALLRSIDFAVSQGAKGGVEVSDQARRFALVASSANQYGGDVVQRMAELSAMAQIARSGGGASTAAEALRTVSRFTDQLRVPARAKEMAAAGVKVRGADGLYLPAPQIIENAIRATDGDPLKMKRMFASTIGDRGVMGLLNTYNRAGRGDAGIQAVRAEWARLLENPDLERIYSEGTARRMGDKATQAARSEQAFDDAMAKLADEALPQLTQALIDATPALETLASVAAKATSYTVDNPAKAGAALVTGALAYSALQSGGRALVERTVEGSMAVAGGAALSRRARFARAGGAALVGGLVGSTAEAVADVAGAPDWMGALLAAGSGALVGAQFGGPWGALAGGLAGGLPAVYELLTAPSTQAQVASGATEIATPDNGQLPVLKADVDQEQIIASIDQLKERLGGTLRVEVSNMPSGGAGSFPRVGPHGRQGDPN